MGIKGLTKLIKSTAGEDVIKTYYLEDFKNKRWRLAVDASLIIHQSVSALRSRGVFLTNDKGQETAHIKGILHKIINLVEYSITPIFVFDGKAPEIKKQLTCKRRDNIQLLEGKILTLEKGTDEYNKCYSGSYHITQDDVDRNKNLLDLMGIPYVDAPEEADVLCAWLTQRKDKHGRRLAKGVISDDSDMLPLGVPYLFKNMASYLSAKKPIQVILLKSTLRRMDLTFPMFVDMCILLGTDYSNNIAGIGPKTAYKHIHKYHSLDNVINSLDKQPPVEQIEQLKAAQDYFINSVKRIDTVYKFKVKKKQVHMRSCKQDELIDYLIQEGFVANSVITAVNRLVTAQQELNI